MMPPSSLYRFYADGADVRKACFFVDHDTSREIDLHAESENEDGTDLMIEVKD